MVTSNFLLNKIRALKKKKRKKTWCFKKRKNENFPKTWFSKIFSYKQKIFGTKEKMKNRNLGLDEFGRNAASNRSLDSDDFFDDVLGPPGSASQAQFGLSLQERIRGHLPLPKLGLSSPWLKTGRTTQLLPLLALHRPLTRVPNST